MWIWVKQLHTIPQFLSQEEQAQPVSKFYNLAKGVVPKKRKDKDQDYQEDIQKVVKKKYRVAEIKKYLEDVATALA
ncbi:hypothetical protein DSO57_1007053, partial [Entomophthora muscae]